MKLSLVLMLSLLFVACATPRQSIIPDQEMVKVSRDKPKRNCTEIGPVSGSAITVKATPEEVIEDMKKDAARKGANYVHLQGHSATGTAASGVAYDCR